jgi:hypothetical protein
VVAGLTRLTQSPEPSQVSAASQPVAVDEPQVTVLAAKASVGQVTLEPLHISAGSHAASVPAGRHIVAEVLKRVTQAPEPLQVSGALQSVLSGDPHATLVEDIASAGQVVLVPLQSSAGSHWAFAPAARQTVAAAFTRAMQLPAPSHVSASLHAVVSAEPHAVPSEDFT